MRRGIALYAMWQTAMAIPTLVVTTSAIHRSIHWRLAQIGAPPIGSAITSPSRHKAGGLALVVFTRQAAMVADQKQENTPLIEKVGCSTSKAAMDIPLVGTLAIRMKVLCGPAKIGALKILFASTSPSTPGLVGVEAVVAFTVKLIALVP